MSNLRRAAEEYLAIRRAVGFKLDQTERMLASFVAFAESENATRVSTDMALRWATLPSRAKTSWWRQRLCVVRCFARHLSALDPGTEVPPLDVLPAVTSVSVRATPYLYSASDVAALMGAAADKRSPFTTSTCRALIGLLSVTGMRVGEALRLDNDDIDWDRGTLVVRQSKFERSREVPLHHSTVQALAGYMKERDERFLRPRCQSLFVAWSGGRLSYGGARWHFEHLARAAGLVPRSANCRPRLHDFRHSFACATLEDWYSADVDLAARLPLLSAYLGHVDPASTYWYLSAKPELLAMAAGRLERRWGAVP